MDDKIIIYQTADGETSIDVKLDRDTVWLSAEQMATLFDRDSKTIRKHINNAISEELADYVVVAKFATTTKHGAIEGKTQQHEVSYYNLDVILSVGYRVKSKRDACCTHSYDSRKSNRREGYNGQGGCKSHQ